MKDVSASQGASPPRVAGVSSGIPKPTTRQIVAFIVVVVPLLGTVVAALRGLLYGFQAAELWIFAVFYAITMFALTIGYHRLFAHLSFKTSNWMRMLLGISASMCAQGPVIAWVADHRRHHACSDAEGDPHSPRIYGDHFMGRVRGLWHGHVGWMFTMEETNWVRYVPDLIKDRTTFWLHRNYLLWVAIGLLIPTLVGWWVIGSWQGALSGFLWGGLVRIFLVNHALWAVGSFSHMFGGAPFRERTGDFSTNNWWVALLTFGEGNQNNHHAFPASARHGLVWWQPDFSWLAICGLKSLGLIWDLKMAPKAAVASAYSGGSAGNAQNA